MHDLLLRAWNRHRAYQVGHYVILPDHVHLFIRDLGNGRIPLSLWVRNWKSFVTDRWSGKGRLWQRSFWDRQLRTANDYNSKWLYVRNNPARHGLVPEAEDWPYQGQITDF